ncbi:MAG: hypothetical protein ACFFD2_26470, partial [Promethearchaeota archaeon]
CIWRQCCVFFSIRPVMYVYNSAYEVLNSQSEAINLSNEIDTSFVEVYFADRFDPLIWGGGASISSGTAAARVVTCDQQLRVPDPANPGEFLGAVNVNHLAHELGHVIGLAHPGSGSTTLVDATAGTVMEPSGFYADNPHAQSQFNCDNVSNPLFKFLLISKSRKCVQNPEIP